MKIKKLLLYTIRFIIPIIITEICVFTIHHYLVEATRGKEFRVYELNREAESVATQIEIGFNEEILKLKTIHLLSKDSLEIDYRELYGDSCTDYVQVLDKYDNVQKVYHVSDGDELYIEPNFSKSRTVLHLLSYSKDTGKMILSNVIHTKSPERVYILAVIPRYDTNKIFSGYTVGQINISETIDRYTGNLSESIFFDYSITRNTFEGIDVLFNTNELYGHRESYTFNIGDDSFRIEVAYKREWSRLSWFLSILGGVLIISVFLLIVSKLREKHTENLIFRDTLTNAYNKRMLNRVFNEYTREGKPFSLIYLDINKFKSVNDTRGHSAGDMVLVTFVDRVSNSIKKKDKIFRVGGDEFVLFLDGNLSEDTLNNIILKRIYRTLNRKFEINNTIIDVSVSAGYARYPQDSKDLAELIDIADRFMYKEKHSA